MEVRAGDIIRSTSNETAVLLMRGHGFGNVRDGRGVYSGEEILLWFLRRVVSWEATTCSLF
jgi:hypothetical protein